MAGSRALVAVAVLSMLAARPRAQSPVPVELSQLKEPAIVGLIEMPWLYGADPAAPASVPPLTAYASPSDSSPPRVTLDSQGVHMPDGPRVCAWVRDYDAAAGAQRGCEFTEAGYEEPALRVLAVAPGNWYRLDLSGVDAGETWIQSTNRFHSILDLLAGDEHLNYINLQAFDGWIYTEPDGARLRFVPPRSRDGEGEQPYEAVEHTVVNGRLWVYVRIFNEVCGAPDPREIARGWMPATNPLGVLQMWFWSRGC